MELSLFFRKCNINHMPCVPHLWLGQKWLPRLQGVSPGNWCGNAWDRCWKTVYCFLLFAIDCIFCIFGGFILLGNRRMQSQTLLCCFQFCCIGHFLDKLDWFLPELFQYLKLHCTLMIPSKTWTSWSFPSACTTWTTTGWLTWRRWPPSLRPWTASRGSSQVGSSWWNNDEINLLLSSRIDLLRRWWKFATHWRHSTESFWCFQGAFSRLLIGQTS